MFKLITLNINKCLNLAGTLDLIKSESPAFLFLQECSLKTEQLAALVARYGYTGFCSLREHDLSGVAVVYLSQMALQEIQVLVPGRLILVQFSDFSFINCYAPSGSQNYAARRDLFNEHLLRHLKLKIRVPILLGDFNCVISQSQCVENFKLKKSEELKSLVNLFSYKDAFEICNPNKIEFTYHKSNASPSRIDRIYVPECLIGDIQSCQHLPTLSDHRAVVMSFVGNPVPPGPRGGSLYFKLNTVILKEPDFLPNFQNFWDNILIKSDNYENEAIWWDEYAKPAIRTFLQRFSRMRSEGRKGLKNFLFRTLDRYLSQGRHEEASVIRERLKVIVSEDCLGYTI